MNYYFACLMTRLSLRHASVARRTLVILLLTLGLGLFGSPHPTYAATLEVDRLDDEPTATACTAAANDCSLRGAILAANNLAGPDIINVPTGIYTLTVGSELSLTSEITLEGADAATTIVQASTTYATATHRVMSISSGATVTISGLTLRYGKADTGGGIYNNGGILTIEGGTIVSGNIATQGGGIYNVSGGQVTITGAGTIIGGDTADEGNKAGKGGGIYNTDNGSIVRIEVGAAVSGNSANIGASEWQGGGIYNTNGGQVTITGSGTVIGGDTAGEGNKNEYGAGIYNDTNGTVTVEDGASISSNASGWGGGGIHNEGTLIVNHAAFSSNTATHGAGILNYGSLTLTNSTFSGNTAYYFGGALFTSTNALAVTNCIFSDNPSHGQGGAIYTGSDALTITDSTLSGNTAEFGGGIYNTGTLTLTNSIVSNNTASYYGGGIYNSNGGQVTITGAGTIIGGDTADEGNKAEQGGGIYNADSGSIVRIEAGAAVSGNSASLGTFHEGGGIYNTNGGQVTITGTGTTIGGDTAEEANTATEDGGGIYNENGTITIENGAAISGNTAVNAGGAIWNESGTVTLQNSALISGNSGYTAGGIYNNGTLIVQGNSQFSANTASGSWGGGIYNGGVLTVTDSTFINNSSTSYGGAIYTDTNPVTVTNTTFSNNMAQHGGGIYFWYSPLTVTNSIFSGNAATDDGGGIYNDVGMLTVANSTFSTNTANRYGGGIASSGTVTVNSSTFSSNTASETGGGIIANGPLTITNSTFSGNSSTNGGGIASDNANVTNSTFFGNSAIQLGGAIYNEDGTLTATNTIVANSLNGGNCDVETVIDGGNNLSSDGTCGFSLLNTDPKLGPLANNGGPIQTHLPLLGSPAIDAGNNSVCADPATVNNLDQRGEVRPFDGNGDGVATCDIGAVERRVVVPTLSISDATITEGDTGTSSLTFTVTRSGATDGISTVQYATVDGTATAGSDYVAASGTMTLTSGDTSEPITITINGDTVYEPDETFVVNLSNASFANITDSQGTGTITDNDDPPTLSISDVTLTEGDTGTVNADFSVTLSVASSLPITVQYTTADSTASALGDYTTTTGMLTFSAGGSLTQTVTVPIIGDLLDENDETFTLSLSNPVNAALADGQGTGTITDDDDPPALSIDNVTITEGNTGTVNADFTVTLSAASSLPITVQYTTADDTASEASDFIATSGTLTFIAGDTEEQINVVVQGDMVFEPDETFVINLSAPTNATLADGQGQATIQNDDGPPTLAVDSPTIAESAGTGQFTVTLNPASSGTTTVAYTLADGSATSTDDYTATKNGTLTFDPGVTSQPIPFAVVNDTLVESDETLTVTLNNPTGGAVIGNGTGTATITDDDTLASISINDASGFESSTGTITFTVTRAHTNGTSQVDYTTADGTALAGSDYTVTEGTLIFEDGESSKTIVVQLLGDSKVEASETFVVTLSNPQQAEIGDGQGQGTITNSTPKLKQLTHNSYTRDTTPTFTWSTITGATRYQLQVDNNADFSSPLFTVSATTLSYTRPRAMPDGRYYWRVRARDAARHWGGWSPRWAFTVDTTPPARPVLVAPANGATTTDPTPMFRWQAVTGAARYTLQVDNNSDFSSPIINRTQTTTTYTPDSALAARTYYWRVRAQDKAGNVSAWSERWSFRVTGGAVIPPVVTPTAEPVMSTPEPTQMLIPTALSTLTSTPTEMVINSLLPVESDHPAVQQTGIWTSHVTDLASGGSYLYSSGNFEDVLTLTFTGTQLEVIYVKHPALGTFAVEIDGTVIQLVDSVAAESEFGVHVVVSDLADGQHTVRLYPVAGVVALDAFHIEALPDVVETTPIPTDIPIKQPTLDITPTEVPPDVPTLSPSATATPLPLTLPFIETFDSGLNWIPVDAWTFDTQTAYRGAGWFADSTTRGQNSTLTFGALIDLRTALHPELSFWQKMALANEDLFTVEVSTDGGLTWQALDLQSGSTMDWTQRTMDLPTYRGQVISLRFRLDTTNPLPEGAMTMGMWVDELVIQEAQPTPTQLPTDAPTVTDLPTSTPIPTETPTATPTETPSPTAISTDAPTAVPTETPTPTEIPIETPEPVATEKPAS